MLDTAAGAAAEEEGEDAEGANKVYSSWRRGRPFGGSMRNKAEEVLGGRPESREQEADAVKRKISVTSADARVYTFELPASSSMKVSLWPSPTYHTPSHTRTTLTHSLIHISYALNMHTPRARA